MEKLISLFVALLFSAESMASCGFVKKLRGEMDLVKGKEIIRSLEVDDEVCHGDVLKTRKASRAKIKMEDGNVISLGARTKIKLTNYNSDKKQSEIDLAYGYLRSKVKQKYKKKSEYYRVRTRAAVAGVRGTDFATEFDENTNEARVVTFTGRVAVRGIIKGIGRSIEPVIVEPGHEARLKKGQKKPRVKKLPKEKFKQDQQRGAVSSRARDTKRKGSGPGSKSNRPRGNMLRDKKPPKPSAKDILKKKFGDKKPQKPPTIPPPPPSGGGH